MNHPVNGSDKHSAKQRGQRPKDAAYEKWFTPEIVPHAAGIQEHREGEPTWTMAVTAQLAMTHAVSMPGERKKFMEKPILDRDSA